MQPQENFSIAERWSPFIAAKGFSAVPMAFLNMYSSLKITPTEAMVIIHVMAFKWSKRNPFPSVARLSQRLGLSDGQVRSHLRKLEKKGFLKRIKRSGRSNEFDFQSMFEVLEIAMKQKAEESELEADAAEVSQDEPLF